MSPEPIVGRPTKLRKRLEKELPTISQFNRFIYDNFYECYKVIEGIGDRDEKTTQLFARIGVDAVEDKLNSYFDNDSGSGRITERKQSYRIAILGLAIILGIFVLRVGLITGPSLASNPDQSPGLFGRDMLYSQPNPEPACDVSNSSPTECSTEKPQGCIRRYECKRITCQAHNVLDDCIAAGVAAEKIPDRHYKNQAMIIYEHACSLHRQGRVSESGSGDKMVACYLLGKILESEKAVRDISKAREWYTIACEGGHGMACSNLGRMYEQCRGSPQRDRKIALTYYQKACTLRSSIGCVNQYQFRLLSGIGHDSPEDFLSDYREIVKYCAPHLHDVASGLACSIVGHLYDEGRGVRRDETIAKDYHERSCKTHFSPSGCQNLAAYFHRQNAKKRIAAGKIEGEGGMVKDIDENVWDLYKDACDRSQFGDLAANSCAWIGYAYMEGTSTVATKDIRNAEYYLKKACDLGTRTGCAGLNILYEKSPELDRSGAKKTANTEDYNFLKENSCG